MPDPLMNAQVVQYLDQLVPERPDEVKNMELHAKEHSFPIIGPAAGNLCYMLARMIGAKRIFELGSGYGYSTYWFAQAVKENGGGEVHHVVWDQTLSMQARQHLARLGLGSIVKYQVREAVEALNAAEGQFDIIFNDIDKAAYPDSLAAIEPKLRPGGLMIVDNMLWSGRIFDRSDQDPNTKGVRNLTRMMGTKHNFVWSILPIRDGVMVAMKK